MTNRLHAVPVVVLMPHSRCNCRCVMCDIWRANKNGRELGREDLDRHLNDFRKLGVQRVALSGGEPLMHSNLWELCEAFTELGIRITLLSTGLLLEPNAAHVVRWCDEVIVSLDGSRDVHDAVRRVPNAFKKLKRGVNAIKHEDIEFRITARCVIQKANFRDLPNIVATARDLGLDGLSFLAADVSSTAFNRPDPWGPARVSEVALDAREVAELRSIIEDVLTEYETEFSSGFIAESPRKMRNLVDYFSALLGQNDFPKIVCNAPWVSTVVEADGLVRPCFFHEPLGNIKNDSLANILNAPASIEFRRNLDVESNEICRSCVCTLHLSPGSAI